MQENLGDSNSQKITKIHLVRHGEVDNPTGVLYGRKAGFHLTSLGLEMAQELGKTFSENGHDIRAVITSPLERAIETGTPTAQAFGLEIQQTPDLIEADNKFEGLAINNNPLILLHPKYWRWYRNPFQPSWGEPYSEVVTRMSRAIRNALEISRGGEAVLVSHQLPIWTIRRFIEGKPLAHHPGKRECSLASCTTLEFQGNRLVALKYWEPVANLLAQAEDMVPGTSQATKKTAK